MQEEKSVSFATEQIAPAMHRLIVAYHHAYCDFFTTRLLLEGLV